MKPSAVIITLDAARDIERCLASLDFAAEIVVVDHGSRDRTVEICRAFGATVHERPWRGFGPAKREAVALARGRWVLSVDADEEVGPALREAILALPEAPAEAAFAVNRLSRFLGRWIRHCGWHPEWVVRLFDRERAAFDEKPVHESVRAGGPVGRLDGLLLHHTYDTMGQYIAKLNQYTSLAAGEAARAGRRAGPAGAVLRGWSTFLRMYVLRAGFLDGAEGLALCACSGFYTTSKYLKLWRGEDAAAPSGAAGEEARRP